MLKTAAFTRSIIVNKQSKYAFVSGDDLYMGSESFTASRFYSLGNRKCYWGLNLARTVLVAVIHRAIHEILRLQLTQC